MRRTAARDERHFLTLVIFGCCSTGWALYTKSYLVSILWLSTLLLWVILRDPQKVGVFFRRIYQMGSLLLVVSLFQLIFRREGEVLLSWNGFPLIFSAGLREAVLLWMRYLIIFVLAYLIATVSLFKMLLFFNKMRVSTQFSLLLLTTFRFMPFLFREVRKGLWTIRFSGIKIAKLKLFEKYTIIKKLLKPLLFRSVDYAAFSSLGLELRGYGKSSRAIIPVEYPLKAADYLILLLTLVLNLISLYIEII
ncbi:MAG: energy-coupling factor transporter transmembrane component T [bacterium]|nr:energy-coupling factor transporter transmembrane component T [bacterium]